MPPCLLPSTMRILLVEDSPKLSAFLDKALRQRGYAVDLCVDGAQADSLLCTEQYDGLVLDLSLPSMDGLEVLARLRDRGARTPVLVLTARGELENRVHGLRLGADDYLPKPFALEELEARLQAIMRRSAGVATPTVRLGALTYNSSSREFTLGSERLDLRPKEHAVLEALLARSGQAISKAQLYEHVFSIDATTSCDVVEIYIHRLRKQLHGSGVHIVTRRGLGYVLEAG